MWDVKRLDCYWKAVDLIVVFDEVWRWEYFLLIWKEFSQD